MLPKDAFSVPNVLRAGATVNPPGLDFSSPRSWVHLGGSFVHFGFLPCSQTQGCSRWGPKPCACSLVPRQGLTGRWRPGAAPAPLHIETLGRTLLRAGAGQRGGLD